MPNNDQRGYPLSGAGFALAITCLAYFVPSYAQYQISPFGASIMERFGIEPGRFSLLFSSPMIPAIFLSLAAGLLIDRLGPKRVVGFGLAGTTLGCIMRMLATGFPALLTGTALTGLAACFLSAGAAKILAGYYGPDGVGPKMGVLMAASTGAMAVALATSALLGREGTAFAVSSALSAAALVLWLAFLKDPETQAAGSSLEGPSMAECLKAVARSRSTWMVAFAVAFIFGGNVVVGSFAPTALAEKGFDAGSAGLIASLYSLGNLAGCFTAPALAGLVGGRQKPVMLAYAVLAAVGVAVALRPSGAAAISILMLLAGNFVGGLIPMCYALPVQFEEVGQVYAGTAGGVIVTAQVLGAVLLPSFVITGIAGNSFPLMFLLGGACLLATCLLLALAEYK